MQAEDEPESGKIVDFNTMEVDTNAVEIKGCMFEHTALRQAFMSSEIDVLLKNENKLSGITPIGIWKYKIGGDEPIPDVEKYCGLYRTFGERRLASHLLAGLELLLPILVPSLTGKTVLDFFPKERRPQYRVKENNVTRVAPMIPTEIAIGKSPPVDGRFLPLPEVAPAYPEFAQLLQFWNAVEKKDVYNFEKLWNESSQKLRDVLSKRDAGIGSIIAGLYWRIGHEVGEFNLMLRKNGISWGYFRDHWLEAHNNK
jgi:hypothetical protein